MATAISSVHMFIITLLRKADYLCFRPFTMLLEGVANLHFRTFIVFLRAY